MNLAGLGEFCEIFIQISGANYIYKHLHSSEMYFYFIGNAHHCPVLDFKVSEEHFTLKSVTFWEEFIFVSNHGDAPKVG